MGDVRKRCKNVARGRQRDVVALRGALQRRLERADERAHRLGLRVAQVVHPAERDTQLSQRLLSAVSAQH